MHQIKDEDHYQVADGDHLEVAVGTVAVPHRAPHADEGDQQRDLGQRYRHVRHRPAHDGRPGNQQQQPAEELLHFWPLPDKLAVRLERAKFPERALLRLKCNMFASDRGQERRKITKQNHSIYFPIRWTCRKLPILDGF